MTSPNTIIADLTAEVESLRKQRDAWKEVAEHHYGLLRISLYGDSQDYPVSGALDAWATGRHPILSEIIAVKGGDCGHEYCDCRGYCQKGGS